MKHKTQSGISGCAPSDCAYCGGGLSELDGGPNMATLKGPMHRECFLVWAEGTGARLLAPLAPITGEQK